MGICFRIMILSFVGMPTMTDLYNHFVWLRNLIVPIAGQVSVDVFSGTNLCCYRREKNHCHNIFRVRIMELMVH